MPNRGKRAVVVFIFACSLVAGEASAVGLRQTEGIFARIGRLIAKLRTPISTPVASSQELTPPIPGPKP